MKLLSQSLFGFPAVCARVKPHTGTCVYLIEFTSSAADCDIKTCHAAFSQLSTSDVVVPIRKQKPRFPHDRKKKSTALFCSSLQASMVMSLVRQMGDRSTADTYSFIISHPLIGVNRKKKMAGFVYCHGSAFQSQFIRLSYRFAFSKSK